MKEWWEPHRFPESVGDPGSEVIKLETTAKINTVELTLWGPTASSTPTSLLQSTALSLETRATPSAVVVLVFSRWASLCSFLLCITNFWPMVAISTSEWVEELISVSCPDARRPGKVSGVFCLDSERQALFDTQEGGDTQDIGMLDIKKVTNIHHIWMDITIKWPLITETLLFFSQCFPNPVSFYNRYHLWQLPNSYS